MNDTQTGKSPIEEATEDLFSFATERDDVKWILGQLSQESKVKPVTVEYELQILKIVGVGWGLSYYLEGTPKLKAAALELYWRQINEYSKQLSEATGLMIGQDIDYFEIIKKRLKNYLRAMEKDPEAKDPTVLIGPAFAGECGHSDDIFASLAGTKMFTNTITRVRQYLEAVKLR